MTKIYIKVKKESETFLESGLVLATHRNFPSKMWQLLTLFPQNMALLCILFFKTICSICTRLLFFVATMQTFITKKLWLESALFFGWLYIAKKMEGCSKKITFIFSQQPNVCISPCGSFVTLPTSQNRQKKHWVGMNDLFSNKLCHFCEEKIENFKKV